MVQRDCHLDHDTGTLHCIAIQLAEKSDRVVWEITVFLKNLKVYIFAGSKKPF